MKLLLVRHGEVKDKENPLLTKKGRKEAKILARRLSREDIDSVYASDLKRTKETAHIIEDKIKKIVLFTDVLREIPDEIVYKKKTNWKNTKKNNEIIKRVKDFLVDLEKKHPMQKVLIVGHGNMNKLISAILLDLNFNDLTRFLQSHGNITCLHKDEEKDDIKLKGWRVLLWNDLTHMPRSLRTSVNI